MHNTLFSSSRIALAFGGLVLLTGLLSGCASVGSQSGLGRDLRLVAGEPVGWLVASVAVRRVEGDAVPFETNEIHFRPSGASGGRATGSMSIHIADYSERRISMLDIVDDGLYASVHRVALRPGEYSLVGGTMQTDVGTLVVRQKVDDEDIRFTVREGQTTYLGSFAARTVTGHNRRGNPVRLGAYFEVGDHMTRDVAVLDVRETDDAPYGEVVPSMLEIPAAPGRFFMREPATPGDQNSRSSAAHR